MSEKYLIEGYISWVMPGQYMAPIVGLKLPIEKQIRNKDIQTTKEK